MNRKFLCVLFSLFVALNTFAADKFQVGDLYYSIVSNEEQTVKVEAETETMGARNYASLTDIAIPSTISHNGTEYSVTEIAYDAFNYAPNLTSVTIPVSITKIEDVGSMPEWNAFYNSLKLKSIQVAPENQNYMSIDGVLFTKDKKMLISYPTTKEGTKYNIPEGVEKIGTYAFNGCSFSEVVLPSTLTTLCHAAFHNCSKVTTVVCHATTPPAETYGWTFAYTNQEILYVPESVIDIYKANDLWGNFKQILAIPDNLIVFDESNDQTLAQLQELNNQTKKVMLNRQFDADGAWYTLCLPFNLTEEQVQNSLGEECALRKLQYAEKRSEDLLYIHFATVTTIEAGTPYLFRPAVDVFAPAFPEVKITYQTNTTLTTPDGLVSMTGIYAPTRVPEDKWYLGPNDTLYQPLGEVTSKGFRAYFTLPSSLNNTQGLRACVVMDSETPTDIVDIQEDTITPPARKVFENGQILILRSGHKYNLQGQVVE